MEIHVYRTNMAGITACSYDVYVTRESAPAHAVKGCGGYSIRGDSQEYLRFTDATVPDGHYDLTPGLDRYEAWQAHERAALRKQLRVAKLLYPELRALTEWPTLWVNGINLDSAMRTTSYP